MPVRFYRNKKQIAVVEECISSLNILGHAQMIEFDLGSECGGHGICGKDRVQILEAQRIHFSPVTEHEKEHLTTAEIGQGWRLACQVYPQKNDLSLEIQLL